MNQVSVSAAQQSAPDFARFAIGFDDRSYRRIAIRRRPHYEAFLL